MSDELISLNDAVKLGIDKLRRPNWVDAADYVKIDIVKGELGPWMHLYSPSNMAINGRNPVDVLVTEREWREEKAYLPWRPN